MPVLCFSWGKKSSVTCISSKPVIAKLTKAFSGDTKDKFMISVSAASVVCPLRPQTEVKYHGAYSYTV